MDALISDAYDDSKSKSQGAAVSEISIDQIEANPWQPRSNFDEESLNELAASISAVGIIQPLTVYTTQGVKVAETHGATPALPAGQ